MKLNHSLLLLVISILIIFTATRLETVHGSQIRGYQRIRRVKEDGDDGEASNPADQVEQQDREDAQEEDAKKADPRR